MTGVMKRAACWRPRKMLPSTILLFSTIDVDKIKKCSFKFDNNDIFLFFKILTFWVSFGIFNLVDAVDVYFTAFFITPLMAVNFESLYWEGSSTHSIYTVYSH